MDKLVAEIIHAWPNNFATNNRYSITVALSGGVDSVAFLHILSTIAQISPFSNQLNLDAIHINHGISKNAIEWEEFCLQLCNNFNIRLTIKRHVVTKSGGESLENNARLIRYNEFMQHSTDIVALAHHKFDQIETTLSQIFRGSNLHNIAAMRPITFKANKIFWRPLLNCTKEQLEEYAQRNGLAHITDESNFDSKYLRNFIRHDIIPKLITWDKHIEDKILKINEQIQNTLAITDEIAQNDYETCQSNNQLNASKCKKLSVFRQYNLLNYYIIQNNQPLPSTKQLKEFTRQISTCSMDKSPQLKLSIAASLVMKKQVIFIQIRNTAK